MKIHEIIGSGFSSNAFLVTGSEKTMLVDAGLNETSKYVMDEIASKMELKDVDIIFLTHRHCDHVGGAKPILDATGAEIFAPSGEAEAISTSDATTGASMFGVRVDPVPVTSVGEGHVFDLGDCSLEVLHTPGHTSGSICLYEKEHKALLSGDTVFAGGGVGRWDLPTGSLKDLKSSLDRLSQMDIDSMFPGHGPSMHEDAGDSIKLSRRSLEGYWL